jgi:hypothetical protein
MLKAVRAWFRTAAQFPKQSAADLRWLKGVYIVFGIGSMGVALLWFPGWQTAAWAAVGIGWFYQSALARREIRRREGDAASEGPQRSD